MQEEKSNIVKGSNSYDAVIKDSIIPFFNRNITPYPTENNGVNFDLIPVEKQKDIMVNVARLHAQQEYNRIMDLVNVLQTQATQIKRRLEITDAVHSAVYQFQTYHNKIYWLCYDRKKQCNRLVMHGPDEYTTCAPEEYIYISRVKWLGDYTWIEVDSEGNPVN